MAWKTCGRWWAAPSRAAWWGSPRWAMRAGMIRLSDAARVLLEGRRIGGVSAVLSDALSAQGDSSFEIRGGNVNGRIRADERSAGRIRGGEFEDVQVRAITAAVVEIVGEDFALDGERIPLGDVEANIGRLTGTLESGESLDIPVAMSTSASATSRIVLVPEPGSLALQVSALAPLSWLGHRRRSRTEGSSR